jgi:competence protein ComEC
VEKEIIKSVDNIPCDILRVGHHGSNTSTSEEWIKYLNPKEAVISVGKNNKYGHPDKEVISVLKKYQIKIRRTDIEGTIKYWSIFN